MTPNKHTTWNCHTFSFVNLCYTLYARNALTRCGLTFVTSLNVAIKSSYSNTGICTNLQGVLVAWWHNKSAFKDNLSQSHFCPPDKLLWSTGGMKITISTEVLKMVITRNQHVSLLYIQPQNYFIQNHAHLQLWKKLQDANSVARIHFCNCFCDALYSGDISPSLTFFTDEAQIHLKNMHVNTQNNRY